MSFAPELRSHAQRVCSLYKRALRMLEAYYDRRNVLRYHAVLLRARFDANADVSDPKDQRILLWSGNDELFMSQSPLTIQKFPKSAGAIAGGFAAGRVVDPPDWILDYWHPLEKAQYPNYFKTRELRKKEYLKLWKCGQLY